MLVVEDDAYLRFALVELLSPHWDVVEARDGLEALELIERRVPDLVLSDLAMPRLDGFELVRVLRSTPRSAHLPVLIFTAHSRENSLISSFSAGADDFIPKPFTPEELLARTRRLFGVVHARRAAEEELRKALAHAPETESRLRRQVAAALQGALGPTLALLKSNLEEARSEAVTPPPIRSVLESSIALAACAIGELQVQSGQLEAKAVEVAPAGEIRLTTRERQVLQLIGEGKSSVEIGMLLRISSRTVDCHRLKVMRKLRIHTIAGLTKFAVRSGLCTLD